MYINFLFLSVAICLLLLTPLKAIAGDCWIGSLRVKVDEKGEYQRQTKVETGRGSHNLHAEGKVVFNVGERLNIISKNISGNWSSTWFRDTGCVHHEGETKGILTEGSMNQKWAGKHTAYWKLNINAQSTVKNIKGCMQDPIPPIKGSEEQEDWRFEGIVHPYMGKLSSLCSSVKETPALGYCNETSQGFSGQMTKSTLAPGDVQVNEVYEWYAKKVPCDHHPRPDSPVNRCLNKYEDCKEWTNDHLLHCIDLCETNREKNRAEALDPLVPLIT